MVACEQCADSGWYLLAVRYGDPRWGKPQQCACNRKQSDARRASQALARLGDELGSLADRTFDRFDCDRALSPFEWQHKTLSVDAQRTFLRAAKSDCEAYADAPRSWLYIHGSYGSGKSHLAAAIGHVRASRGEQVRYRSTPGMLDALKAGFKDGSSDATFDDLLSCDLLILDDIGAEHLTGWAAERLFRITNERQGLPTILTSNRHMGDLAVRGDMAAERIADRIGGCAATIWLPISSYRRLPRGTP